MAILRASSEASRCFCTNCARWSSGGKAGAPFANACVVEEAAFAAACWSSLVSLPGLATPIVSPRVLGRLANMSVSTSRIAENLRAQIDGLSSSSSLLSSLLSRPLKAMFELEDSLCWFVALVEGGVRREVVN